MTQIASNQGLLIGEISRRTGVNIETIRYYERIEVMPKPRRNEGGQRLYDEPQLNRLGFIKRSRELGFSLKETCTLLTLVDSGEMTCGEVHALTVEHLREVKSKIADLRKLERALKNLAAQCSLGDVSDCPIVETLYGLS
ncbi:MAG: MerR family transcriptional regulator [Deltaproteobacteria bacterium]|nr:MAG: MerR family transcriptional regulator [Deltaproteobacteria bacterium]